MQQTPCNVSCLAELPAEVLGQLLLHCAPATCALALRSCKAMYKAWTENGTQYKWMVHFRPRYSLCKLVQADDVTGVLGLVQAGIAAEVALQSGVQSGHHSLVQSLIAGGADVNAVICNETALSVAAKEGNMGMVQLLIACGGNVGAGEDRALWLAAMYGHVHVITLLLEAGANVHASDNRALVCAAMYGCVSAVQLLLAAGANPNGGGGNALLAAVIEGHVEIVQLLLHAGADVSRIGHALVPPLAHAAKSNYVDIVRHLVAAGIDAQARRAAMRQAVLNGHVELVEVLRAS